MFVRYNATQGQTMYEAQVHNIEAPPLYVGVNNGNVVLTSHTVRTVYSATAHANFHNVQHIVLWTCL